MNDKKLYSEPTEFSQTKVKKEFVNHAIVSASDHFERLHNDAHGVVLVWEKLASSKRWTKLRPETEAANRLVLDAQNKGLDRYLSVNEFDGWRCVRDLKSLRSCFVDIDGIYDFESVMSAVQSARLPTPNMAVFSGRGTHLYWQIDPASRSSLALWQLVQDEIVRRLKASPEALNVDLQVKDCTRILRLVGSVNSKNGEEVRGLVLTPWKWDLDTLAYEVLGEAETLKTDDFASALALDVQREASIVRSFSAAQARKGTAKRGKYGSIYERWSLVYRDLIAIGDANFLGIPEGHRNQWLYLYATSLSWFAEPASLSYEIESVAKSYTQGLKIKEVRDLVKPILARVESARAGQKVVWNGQEIDPRFRFKRSTLLEQMAPIIPESLYADLRAIIPDALREERRNERFEARYDDHNTNMGYRVNSADKVASARLMRAAGQSIRTIASELSVSIKTVQRWVI